MGTFTKKLLAEWNLSNLQDDFQRHCIGEIIMPFLDKETIKGLIPQLGIRVDFMLKWNERYGKNDCLTNQANVLCSQELCQVRQILQNDYQGGLILKNYIKTKLLSRKSANTVVDIIISELLKDYDRKNCEINCSIEVTEKFQFDKCAVQKYWKCIVEIFLTESIMTYYIVSISRAVSRANKSIPSRGKLVDKYRNRLRQKRVMSEVVKTQKTEVSQAEFDDKNNDEKVTQSVEWLKINRAPWKDVLGH
ncbi:hypothetical protein PV325_007039 [Microctonus aethiopoides]|nr:hypothetical protein PV325_007039 [Microctonus aethiopoides]